jgi:hypothetical protein
MCTRCSCEKHKACSCVWLLIHLRLDLIVLARLLRHNTQALLLPNRVGAAEGVKHSVQEHHRQPFSSHSLLYARLISLLPLAITGSLCCKVKLSNLVTISWHVLLAATQAPPNVRMAWNGTTTRAPAKVGPQMLKSPIFVWSISKVV